jgi:tRNA threonylcarbamoyladenosine modification (KEOPS) complex Cgi121 subunit
MSGSVDFMDRVQIFCYSNVENGGELVSRTDEKTRVAIVDLTLVCSYFHLQAAICKTLLNEQQSSMKTKSVSAELLYQLSSTTKINDSLKQCGASETCTQIAILIIDNDPVGMELIQLVKGTAFDVQELGSAVYCTAEKAATIAKYFKVTPQELEISTLEAAVVTRLAIKDLL